MIKLGTARKEPLRLDLGVGASILYRPMTSIDREAGLAAARRFLEEARGGLAAFSRYGVALDSEWIADSDLAIGVAAHINLVEMALRVILSWEGIADAEGESVPVTRENIAALLRDPLYSAMVQEAIMRPLLDLDAEGNGSASSPNGALAGALTTAPAAPPSAPPAPAASEASTESPAPSAESP